MTQDRFQVESIDKSPPGDEFMVIGKQVARVDARAKVTGAALYAGDIYRPNLLHAKLLHSPYAHANIKSINVERARSLQGVAAVLTYKDVPQIYYTSCGHPHPSDTPEDTLILSKRLRYRGDVVAAVAAESKEIASAALDLIEVEYEILPAYFTPEDSLAEGAFEIHKGSKNICGQSEYEIGNVDAAMAKADYIVEDEFRTPIVTHCQIETHTSLTELDSNGRLLLYIPTQVSSIMRERTALALGLNIRDVRVIRTTVGGGFGGKQEPVFEILNAALTLATSRPVRLELSREENLSCTRTRNSSYFKLRTGIRKDGTILARELYAVNNGGAYASHGHNVLASVSSQFGLLYPTPNLRFEGITVYSNILIAGAMRGYGIPQYCSAMESHVDKLAATVGMDPLDYRRKVMFKKNSPINIDHWTINTFGLPEVVDKCEKEIGYRDFRSQQKREETKGSVRRGIGIGLSSYGQSCYPWSVEMSGARVMVNEDGSASLIIGSAEIGQGSDTTMQMIAAEALGVPFDSVNVISGDTDICPFDVGAFASRQTYVSGHAVKKAALACKKQILDFVAEKYSINRSRLDIKEAYIIDTKNKNRVDELKNVTMMMVYNINEPTTICHDASFYPTDNVLTYNCTMAIVAVDINTGHIEIEKIVSVIDSGRLINPQAAMGQLIGGSVMSLGFGMTEQIIIDTESGAVLNDNMLDYKILSFADFPDIEGYFVETDEPSSAYGNKSLGEPPCISPAVAVRNAVLDATGVAIDELPLTPERVFKAMSGKR